MNLKRMGLISMGLLIILILIFIFYLDKPAQLLNKEGQVFTLNSLPNEIDIQVATDKIIVKDSHIPLKLYTSNTQNIISLGSLRITADSDKKALDIANNLILTTSHSSGNIMYLEFVNPPAADIITEEISLTIPGDLELEINNYAATIDIYANYLRSDWHISNYNDIAVTIPAAGDLSIKALVPNIMDLSGNINWQVEKPTLNQINKLQGTYVVGEPKHELTLISEEAVTLGQYT